MSTAERSTAWSIEIDGLSYSYAGQERPALSGLSLRVEAGEHVAIVGPNGAGKSTLLLHLNGILLPASGSVRIGDLTVEPATLPEIRNRVGLVFQEPDDQLFMPTLLEDVTFGPLCQGLPTDEARRRARSALEDVGLGHVDADRAAHHLSGGEKRRAAVATALSTDPGVLAFDEPCTGLDGRGRRTVAGLLRERSQTVVIVTHDVEFAAAVCPRMVLVDGGAVVADEPSRDLLDDGRLLRQHGLELARWLHNGNL